MLHDGQKFHMRESQLFHVLSETRGSLAISERAVVLLGNAHPRSEMHFVDGMGGAQRIALVALLHPFPILPLVGEIPHDRGGARRPLIPEAEGISFVDAVAVAVRFDMK